MFSNFSLNFTDGEVSGDEERNLIGYYSVDNNLKFKQDLSELRYYKPVISNPIKIDLNKAIKNVSFVNDHIVYDGIFKWISCNFKSIYAKDSIENCIGPDFVCYQGTFLKILNIPNENYNGWITCAAKLQGTIYLYEYPTPESISRKPCFVHNRFRLWGKKFEQHVTSHDPNIYPSPDDILTLFNSFKCIFKSTFNGHKIVYGAEIDAIKSNTKLEKLTNENFEFIEVKSRFMKSDDQDKLLNKYLLIKWFHQIYSTNTNKIICGISNRDGNIKDIRELSIDYLKENASNFWNLDNNNRAVAAVMQIMKDNVREDFDKYIYKFSWEPIFNNTIRMTIVNSSSQKYNFLPKWFTDDIINQANNL